MGDVELPHAVVREQVVSAVDLVVHIARDADGLRRVTAVAEVAGVDRRGAAADAPARHVGGGWSSLPQRPPRSAAAGPARTAWLGR